jgi:hypothetical protein
LGKVQEYVEVSSFGQKLDLHLQALHILLASGETVA